MKIDIHTHTLPPPEAWTGWPDRFSRNGFLRLEAHTPCCAKMMIDDRFFREVQDNCWDPAKRISECDETGVDIQVLSTVPVMFSYWAKPEDGNDLSGCSTISLRAWCDNIRIASWGWAPFRCRHRGWPRAS